MSDILRVDLSATVVASVDEGDARHVFEIHTAETAFYVGEPCGAEKERQSAAGAEESGRGVECAQRMAKAIRQAWLPVTSGLTNAAAAGLIQILTTLQAIVAVIRFPPRFGAARW